MLGEESLLLWLTEQSESYPSPLDAWREAAQLESRPFLAAAAQRAIWLSRLMHGAQLVYNHLIERDLWSTNRARARELQLTGSTFSGRVAQWAKHLRQDRRHLQRDATWFTTWRPLLTANVPRATIAFIADWTRLVHRDPQQALSQQASDLVQRREIDLKGASSRLHGLDPQRLLGFRGAAGAEALSFRWAITARIADDIRAGLARRS